MRRRGPERDLRRARRLLEIAAVVLELRNDFRRPRPVRLREHERTKNPERVRHVVVAEVLDALVPDLAVRKWSLFRKGGQREKAEYRREQGL